MYTYIFTPSINYLRGYMFNFQSLSFLIASCMLHGSDSFERFFLSYSYYRAMIVILFLPRHWFFSKFPKLCGRVYNMTSFRNNCLMLTSGLKQIYIIFKEILNFLLHVWMWQIIYFCSNEIFLVLHRTDCDRKQW